MGLSAGSLTDRLDSHLRLLLAQIVVDPWPRVNPGLDRMGILYITGRIVSRLHLKIPLDAQLVSRTSPANRFGQRNFAI